MQEQAPPESKAFTANKGIHLILHRKNTVDKTGLFSIKNALELITMI